MMSAAWPSFTAAWYSPSAATILARRSRSASAGGGGRGGGGSGSVWNFVSTQLWFIRIRRCMRVAKDTPPFVFSRFILTVELIPDGARLTRVGPNFAGYIRARRDHIFGALILPKIHKHIDVAVGFQCQRM